jgi:hypothetical protein
MNIFTGLTDTKAITRALSALSYGGICIFYQILTDPKMNPLQIVRQNVVPGHIDYAGSLYREVSDMAQVEVL